MELTTAECCRLADALAHLAEGRWTEFENRLWLGFGDDWHRLIELLVKHRYIRHTGRWKDEPALTEAGLEFLRRLRARPEAAAG